MCLYVCMYSTHLVVVVRLERVRGIVEAVTGHLEQGTPAGMAVQKGCEVVEPVPDAPVLPLPGRRRESHSAGHDNGVVPILRAGAWPGALLLATVLVAAHLLRATRFGARTCRRSSSVLLRGHRGHGCCQLASTRGAHAGERARLEATNQGQEIKRGRVVCGGELAFAKLPNFPAETQRKDGRKNRTAFCTIKAIRFSYCCV